MKFNSNRLATVLLVGFISTACEKTELDSMMVKSKESSSLTSSNLLFEETFEGPSPFSTAQTMEVGDWDDALQYVSNPAFQGAKVARFEIREDQPLIKDGKRAEVTIVKGSEGDIGKNTWYSFAAYFPAQGFEYDNAREVINQWYQDGSPSTSIRIQRDRIILEAGSTIGGIVEHDLGALPKDRWTEFVLHFIHSTSSDGLIEVWINGDKVKTINGGNMYDAVLPKWKIGIYKSAFKYGTSDVTRRILYYDNIRVGNEKATLAEMRAGGSLGTTSSATTTGTATGETTTGSTTTSGTTTGGTTTGSTSTSGTTTGQQVISFTLVNANTDKDIMDLVDGAVVDISDIGTGNFNIRANTSQSTGSVVKFNLTGAASRERLDDLVPYALFGDGGNGDYNSWKAVTGRYTLGATTRTGTKTKVGPATAPAYTINFTIQN